jgi:lipid II:glycine glycyltransferase (peptidoglycan interpeptide bridge formation enzyme)
LDRNWQIITTKNEVNFEIFYNLLSQTAKRQKFPIQTKEYLQKLYSQDFFQVFLLQKDGQFLASWSGIISDNTLVNLYNGNLPEGFKDFSQYFLHLVAMFFAKQNNLEFYDFGGYNPKLSFSSFKDGYKGQIREFFGPVDIILDSKKYKTTNFTITTIKILKKIFSPFK